MAWLGVTRGGNRLTGLGQTWRPGTSPGRPLSLLPGPDAWVHLLRARPSYLQNAPPWIIQNFHHSMGKETQVEFDIVSFTIHSLFIFGFVFVCVFVCVCGLPSVFILSVHFCGDGGTWRLEVETGRGKAACHLPAHQAASLETWAL